MTAALRRAAADPPTRATPTGRASSDERCAGAIRRRLTAQFYGPGPRLRAPFPLPRPARPQSPPPLTSPLYLPLFLLFALASPQRVEIIDSLFPLHDSNYGEALTTSSFLKTWIYPYLGDRDKIGAPYLSHPANDNGKTCPIYMMPWAQPLSEIREYFGESVAMYFAWLGFYGYYLLIPAIVGTGMQLLYYYGIITHYDSYGIKWYMVLFSIFMVVWANYYNMQWTTEEKICAMAWGTSGFEDAEGNRPQFHGDTAEAWWLYGCFGKVCCEAKLRQASSLLLHPCHPRS